MRIHLPKNFVAICLCLGFVSICAAQNAPPTQTPDQQKPADQATPPPSPTPLPTPSITGPLKAAPPNTFDAGPFGKLNVNGIVSGMGLWQGNYFPGDEPTQAALSNGQIFLQKIR